VHGSSQPPQEPQRPQGEPPSGDATARNDPPPSEDGQPEPGWAPPGGGPRHGPEGPAPRPPGPSAAPWPGPQEPAGRDPATPPHAPQSPQGHQDPRGRTGPGPQDPRAPQPAYGPAGNTGPAPQWPGGGPVPRPGPQGPGTAQGPWAAPRPGQGGPPGQYGPGGHAVPGQPGPYGAPPSHGAWSAPGYPPPGPHPQAPTMLPPSVAWRPQPVPRRGPDDDVTTGVFRSHWMVIPLQVIAVALVFVALVGPILTTFGFGWVVMMTVAVVFGSLAYALPSWWYGTFGLRDDHLVVHSGLVMRTSREIPLSRLQAVDVVQPLLMQVFGMAELRIELAGGDRSAIRLRCLRRSLADRMRAAVLAHAAGLPGRSPEAPEWPFYRLPFLLLLGALTFRVPILLSFVLLLMLATAGAVFAEPGVAGALVPLTLGLLRYFWGPLARYTDYYASLSSDGLRLRYGMFQRRMQTVPPGRVQAVRVVEPLLWRALGVARVEANVAGYAGTRQGDSATLLPVAPRRRAYALVNELFPESEAAHVPLVPNRSWTPGMVGVDQRLFVSTKGLFCLVTEIVPVERVQALRLTAGPLARFTGLVSVDVETPPGPVRAHASAREAGEGRGLVDALAAYSRRARVPSAGTERWATRSTLPRRQDAEDHGEPGDGGGPRAADPLLSEPRDGAGEEHPAARPEFGSPGAEGAASETSAVSGVSDGGGAEEARDTPER